MALIDEDQKLREFGYKQRLDRSVGWISSFLLGFAVISATTAVFSGFGFGLATAGPAFVWTFPIATLVFFIWALIAGDLVAKIPLSGYAYQWTSRLVGPSAGWFTGWAGLVGFISGFTGVAYVMAGYVGGLLGIEMTTPIQILISIVIVLFCVLINTYGVRLATALNNIGVGLELVVTLGATAFVAIVAFFVSGDHQELSFLFSAGDTGGVSPYIAVWLTSSLGCIFGLLGVEAAADIAEETKDARRVIPRTMFMALGVSAVVEFFMYVVFLLAIKDPASLTGSASPIADIIGAQVSPWFAKIVVAIAITNILVCVLANMLVATRLTYAMARDNMLPLSRQLRRVSAKHKTPSTAVWATGILSFALLLTAFISVEAFAFILGMSALGYFTVYVLTTSGLLLAKRRGRLPQGEPGTFDLGRWRTPVYLVGLVAFSLVLLALLLLPAFQVNGIVFVITMAVAALWWLLGLRPRLARGDAGPSFALRENPVEGTAETVSVGD
ncbi:APC family permease [Naasia aerilata]|uniref:Amino acid permease n=1 Tax=Naasia aerilata TaxID=1162966 RepID=A0ABM8GEJ3_9MICO|nr:amino acid permease [Naasia aerilata]BDZ46732.1 amino acid permease [Naasia aerilata]